MASMIWPWILKKRRLLRISDNLMITRVVYSYGFSSLGLSILPWTEQDWLVQPGPPRLGMRHPKRRYQRTTAISNNQTQLILLPLTFRVPGHRFPHEAYPNFTVLIKKTRTAYAVLSFIWSLSFKVWSIWVTITTKTL